MGNFISIPNFVFIPKFISIPNFISVRKFISARNPNLLVLTRNEIQKSAYEASMVEFQECVKRILSIRLCTNIVQSTSEGNDCVHNLSFDSNCSSCKHILDFQLTPIIIWKENSSTEIEDVQINCVNPVCVIPNCFVSESTEIIAAFRQIYMKKLVQVIHRHIVRYTEQVVIPKDLFNIILHYHISPVLEPSQGFRGVRGVQGFQGVQVTTSFSA